MSARKKRRREGTVTAPSLEEIGVPESIRQKLDDCGGPVGQLVEDSTTERVVESLRKHGITDEKVLQLFRGNFPSFERFRACIYVLKLSVPVQIAG